MNLGNVSEALTRKYGPLPGYAWAGIGSIAIVLVLRHAGGASASSAPAFLTTPPSAAVTGADALGAGGGGGDGSTPDPNASDVVDPAISTGLPNIIPSISPAPSNPTTDPSSSIAPSGVYQNGYWFPAPGSPGDPYNVPVGALAPPGYGPIGSTIAASAAPNTYDVGGLQILPAAIASSSTPHVTANNTPPAIVVPPAPPVGAPAPAGMGSQNATVAAHVSKNTYDVGGIILKPKP